MIYQLDYNPDGKKNQEEYVQMFEDCGWEYLKDFAVKYIYTGVLLCPCNVCDYNFDPYLKSKNEVF